MAENKCLSVFEWLRLDRLNRFEIVKKDLYKVLICAIVNIEINK